MIALVVAMKTTLTKEHQAQKILRRKMASPAKARNLKPKVLVGFLECSTALLTSHRFLMSLMGMRLPMATLGGTGCILRMDNLPHTALKKDRLISRRIITGHLSAICRLH